MDTGPLRAVPMTVATAKVFAALLDHPHRPSYGLALIRETGLSSGTLYPLLGRLVRMGYLKRSWEDIDPAKAGRPRRCLYIFTTDGAKTAAEQLGKLRSELKSAPATGGIAEAGGLLGGT